MEGKVAISWHDRYVVTIACFTTSIPHHHDNVSQLLHSKLRNLTTLKHEASE